MFGVYSALASVDVGHSCIIFHIRPWDTFEGTLRTGCEYHKLLLSQTQIIHLIPKFVMGEAHMGSLLVHNLCSGNRVTNIPP